MPKYHTEDSETGYGSDYESDGGTSYRQARKIGQGNYSQARLFQSQDHRTIVSLKPQHNNFDIVEAEKKFHFFKTLYPQAQVRFFNHPTSNTYRLVIPEIPGRSLQSIHIKSEHQFIDLSIAAIDALIDCHQKGLVVIDLKEDNIHFDSETNKAYLIDGGLSSDINQAVYPDIFKQHSLDEVNESRTHYPHLAPECWATKKMAAAPTMDVYALGHMMKRLSKKNDITLSQTLQTIIPSCTHENPRERPELSHLKNDLEQIKLEQIKLKQDKFNRLMEQENIILDEHQRQFLTANPSLQQAIVQFICSLQSFNFGRDNKTKKALEEYKHDCISIALQGKEQFIKHYPMVKNKALNVIDHYRFQQFCVAVGNLLLTALAAISVVGVVAMAATSQQRGGFFVFKPPEQKLTQCAENLLKPLA